LIDGIQALIACRTRFEGEEDFSGMVTAHPERSGLDK
jgi:hypothetical protein